MTRLAVLIMLVGIAAGLLTAALRRYAMFRSVIDEPNERSSHTIPTPRGGGVAIVLSFLTAVLFLAVEGRIGSSLTFALVGAGVLTAAVGFIDDHRHIAARWRLLAHFAAAVWGLAWLGGMPVLDWFGESLELGAWGFALVAIYLVWLLNLYNFMDGIDGIAGVEAISVCLGGVLLYLLIGKPEEAIVPLTLAAAVAGFLYWNFPPARIFMGDAGSGFLGIIFGILSLQAALVSPRLFWSWLILLGVFVVDATWTLLRRLCRGERVHEAHRSHAYQRASRYFGRHLPVTVAVFAIDVFWLFPVAMLVGTGRLDGGVGIAIAYAPLLCAAIVLRAGEREFQGR